MHDSPESGRDPEFEYGQRLSKGVLASFEMGLWLNSLPVAVRCCPLLSVAVPCCPLLSVAVRCYPLLSVAVRCYPLLTPYPLLSA